MKRLLTIAAVAGVMAFACLSGGGAGLHAQNRMTFPIVSEDSGHIALGLALRRLNVSGTFMQSAAHPDDEHNALFALFARGMGLARNRRPDQSRRGRPERDRPRAVPRHRRAAHLGAPVGAPDRRRRAVLHPRDRLRLLVRSAGGDRQVGPRRDRRRLRPPDPHVPPRRVPDDEHPGPRRRSRARSDDDPGARSVPSGRRTRRSIPSS